MAMASLRTLGPTGEGRGASGPGSGPTNLALDLALESDTARGETTARVLCLAERQVAAAAATFWPKSSDEDRAIPVAAPLLLVRPGAAATRLAGERESRGAGSPRDQAQGGRGGTEDPFSKRVPQVVTGQPHCKLARSAWAEQERERACCSGVDEEGSALTLSGERERQGFKESDLTSKRAEGASCIQFRTCGGLSLYHAWLMCKRASKLRPTAANLGRTIGTLLQLWWRAVFRGHCLTITFSSSSNVMFLDSKRLFCVLTSCQIAISNACWPKCRPLKRDLGVPVVSNEMFSQQQGAWMLLADRQGPKLRGEVNARSHQRDRRKFRTIAVGQSHEPAAAMWRSPVGELNPFLSVTQDTHHLWLTSPGDVPARSGRLLAFYRREARSRMPDQESLHACTRWIPRQVGCRPSQVPVVSVVESAAQFLPGRGCEEKQPGRVGFLLHSSPPSVEASCSSPACSILQLPADSPMRLSKQIFKFTFGGKAYLLLSQTSGRSLQSEVHPSFEAGNRVTGCRREPSSSPSSSSRGASKEQSRARPSRSNMPLFDFDCRLGGLVRSRG